MSHAMAIFRKFLGVLGVVALSAAATVQTASPANAAVLEPPVTCYYQYSSRSYTNCADYTIHIIYTGKFCYTILPHETKYGLPAIPPSIVRSGTCSPF